MRSDVEAAIKKFKIKTFGNKKNLERVEGMLWKEEEVIYISPTNAIILNVNTYKRESMPGIFVLTNKRVLFSYKAGIAEAVEVFGLSEIKSVSASGNGLTGGHIEIHTMTKIIDILVTYNKKIMQEIADTIALAAMASLQKGV